MSDFSCFDDTQAASLAEIRDVQVADGLYATAFRPASSVVSGPHQGSGVGEQWSDAARESFAVFAGLRSREQAAINGGRNGVVDSGYVAASPARGIGGS